MTLVSFIRSNHDLRHLKLVFAPEAYIPPNARAETLGLDLDQLRSITALRAGIGECTSAIHSLGTPAPGTTPHLSIDDLTDDDLGLLIQALSNKIFGTPEEQAAGKFTRRKLRQLSTWPMWRAAECKQLDAMAKQLSLIHI